MTESGKVTSQRKNGIDLFRLIAALFVLTLHNEYDKIPVGLAEGIQLSTRWAVPFFFMCTGYFLSKKIINGKLEFSRIQNNLVHLISILLVTTILFSPLAIIRYDLVFHVANLFLGVYYHLWFVGAMIFGYVFIWYSYYIGRSNFLPWISVFILVMNLLSSSYNVFIGMDLGADLYNFLISIPFMYIGIAAAKLKLNKSLRPVLILLVVVGFLLQFLEARFIFDHIKPNHFDHKILIGTIVLSVALFLLSATINLRENVLSRLGQKNSLFIYLYHPFAHAIVAKVFVMILPLGFLGLGQVINPSLTFILMISAALIMEKRFKPLYDVLNGHLVKT
jgi:surface polysaccharide O-acyltransferase-like enzyme